jgi:hypothetical protein
MRFRAGLLRVAVLAALCGLLVPLAMSGHPPWETDEDCGPVVFGAHRTTEIETDLPTSSPEHCAYCHWLRAISGVAPSGVGPVVPPTPTTLAFRPANDRVDGATPLGLHPSRAPPALT